MCWVVGVEWAAFRIDLTKVSYACVNDCKNFVTDCDDWPSASDSIQARAAASFEPRLRIRTSGGGLVNRQGREKNKLPGRPERK